MLADAARKAVSAAEGSGFALKVSGSLSRGEVHPWSDLDLVLVPLSDDAEKTFALSYEVMRATGLPEGVDVMFEDEIIEPLRKGLLGSAVTVDSMPPLAGLPDPELALPRCAVSLETILDHVSRTLDHDFSVALTGDHDVRDLMRNTALSMARDRLAYRSEVCLKRLAVFQDGGRSSWLDDRDDDALDDMLARLRADASEPYERPAVLTAEASAAIRWLLVESDRIAARDEMPTDALEAGVNHAVGALSSWAAHLRSISSLTETHGLRPDIQPDSPAL